MKHIKVFWLCLLTLLTATGLRAQCGTEKITVAKCDDGSGLQAYFIPVNNGIKRFGLVDDLSMFCITDSDDVTSIFPMPSMELISQIKPKDGGLCQISRDGYLTAKGEFFTGRVRPNFYTFKNEKLWTCNQEILLNDRRNNVVVCKANVRGQNLVAYDMTTGNELWRKTITSRKRYPWYCFYSNRRNPEVYYLMADSLWRINVKTGTSKSVDFEGGCKANLKFSLRHEVFPSLEWHNEAAASVFVWGGNVTGINSNWLIKGDSIFLADAKNVYCFDHELNKLWETSLPEGVGCKSHLCLDGDVLRMMGFGVAFQQNKTVKFGKPFIATYDRKTGKQQGFTTMKADRKFIGGTYVKGRAYWQDRKSFYYTDEGDTAIIRIDWKPETNRQPILNIPDRVICDTVWTLKEGEMHPVCTDARQLVVQLYNKDVYLIHDDGTSEMLSVGNVYFHDADRFYSTNNSHNPKLGEYPCHYVVTAPDSHRVMKSFHLTEEVLMSDKDLLFIMFKFGVGVVDLNE